MSNESDDKSLSGLRAYLNKEERDTIRARNKAIKELDHENAVLRRALGMKKHIESVPTPKKIRVAYRKTKNPKAFQLHLSDTHSREIVTPGQTNGKNRHNVEIGRERLRSIINQSVSFMKEESKHCVPVHLTVWGGGDFNTNADLHYKMERRVDDEPLEEMLHIYKMLHEELGILWSKTPTDSNSFVGSFSNHGRDSEKMVPGLEAARSYDTVVYKLLRDNYPSVSFTIGETDWTIEDVGGFKTMYTHGHAKKANVRRTTEGIMLPNWNAIRDFRADYGFNAWVQGHHHTRCILSGNKLTHMQNGSLVGANSYSVSQGFPPELACQNMAVIDMKSGLVEKVIALYA